MVSMGGLAASGGYYVSMAVGDTPDSHLRRADHLDRLDRRDHPPLRPLRALLEKLGVQDDSIASHPLKNMGSFAKRMTDEEREIFQALVDDSFVRFKDIIKAGRPKFQQDPEGLDKLATGQIYTAEQALELGLVDKIGFIEDAVDRAIELAQLDKDDVRVVKYQREPTLADILLGVRAPDRGVDLAALLDMTTPRAYYLSTRMTPWVRSRP